MSSDSKTIQGIHLEFAPDEDPIDGNFIAIGWDDLGDLSKLGANREAFKARYKDTYSDEKAGAIPVKAGVNFRFANEMAKGDYVLYPSKIDRNIYLGEIISDYYFKDEGDYKHRRDVRWIRNSPRASFSQPALNEIGSAITLFKISNNFEEFIAYAQGEAFENALVDEIDEESVAETAMVTEQETRDFITKRLYKRTPDQFEEFVRDLLIAMGYFARTTKINSQRHGDGGVDIIASKDELGFEPPVMKVECKRQIDAKHSRPDVQKLIGTLEGNEVGLFITLGTFSTEARILERSKPNLRLIDGDTLANLTLAHYHNLNAKYNALIPLKQIFIPAN